MIRSTSKIVAILGVILLTITASAAIFATIHEFQNIPFNWDPAAHAWEGLIIANDLRSGDIISFLADTYRQGWWPFFHSWLLAPAFILLGDNMLAARVVSLFCLILFIPTIYFISTQISHQRGHWVALIITFLTFTSWPLISNAAICMAEIPGLLMTFFTFLLYLKAIRYERISLFVWVGILMAFTLFTKWHHGVFVIASVLITQLTENRRILSKTNLSLSIPFFLIILVWFIHPQHIISFYEHATFQPHFFTFLSLDNFLFYPKSFFFVYHRSTVIAVLILLGFLYSLRHIRDPKLRLFIIHFFVGIILMLIKLDNRHRYIITIIPSLWISSSIQLVNLVFHFKSFLTSKRFALTLSSIAILFLLLISVFSASSLYKDYADSLFKIKYWSDEKPNQAYKFISSNAVRHSHLAVFGIYDYYNSLKGSTIRWNIEIERNAAPTQNKIVRIKATDYVRTLLRNRDKISYLNFINFIEKRNVTVDEYYLLSFMKKLDEAAYDRYREEHTINPFNDKIIDPNLIQLHVSCLITICPIEETAFSVYSHNFMKYQNTWKEFKKESFPELGITVTIYERITTLNENKTLIEKSEPRDIFI